MQILHTSQCSCDAGRTIRQPKHSRRYLHLQPGKVRDRLLSEVLEAAAARRRPLNCVLHLATGTLMEACLQTEVTHLMPWLSTLVTWALLLASRGIAASSKGLATHWSRGCKGRCSVGCVSWEAGGRSTHDHLGVPVDVLYEAALARFASVHRILHVTLMADSHQVYTHITLRITHMTTNLAGAVVDAIAGVSVIVPVRCQVVRRVDRPGGPLSDLVLLPLILGEELCLLLV